MWTPPSPKLHILTFPSYALKQFLKTTGGTFSWAAVLILPPVKSNLQLSCCASFFQLTLLSCPFSSPSSSEENVMLTWLIGSWDNTVIKSHKHTGFFCSFNWRISALQYCVGVCHTSAWISHRCTYVPSLLNLLPHFTPPVAQCPGLSLLSHRANCHWLSILRMALCMPPCYSLPSSHPLLPSLPCPQVCSLCLCLHCYPANRVISTIFLDSIYYVLKYNICFFLSILLHSV